MIDKEKIKVKQFRTIAAFLLLGMLGAIVGYSVSKFFAGNSMIPDEASLSTLQKIRVFGLLPVVLLIVVAIH